MTTKHLFRLTGTTLAFSAALILSTGCARNSAQNASAPPSVTVAPVEQRQLVEWDVFTGRTEAVEFVEVRPRVSGHVHEARFQSGQLVKKGDVLFVIDPRWHKAEFDRRQAEYEQARVRLQNAEREAGRTGQLLANKSTSTTRTCARPSMVGSAANS
jgi:multidrug efflux pump subunit AcrA (membrane-fusion protein)